MAEEVSSNLDRKLFELLLAISRCLNNMEEMLNTSVLSAEDAAVQQALYEVTVHAHPESRNPSGFLLQPNIFGLMFPLWFCRYSPNSLLLHRFGPIAFKNNYQLESRCLLQAQVLGQRPFSLMLSFFKPFRLFLLSCKNFTLI